MGSVCCSTRNSLDITSTTHLDAYRGGGSAKFINRPASVQQSRGSYKPKSFKKGHKSYVNLLNQSLVEQQNHSLQQKQINQNSLNNISLNNLLPGQISPRLGNNGFSRNNQSMMQLQMFNQSTLDNSGDMANYLTNQNQNNLPSVLREQQYFEEQIRKEHEKQELLNMFKGNWRLMLVVLKMQAIARGIVTRNKMFKKHHFRAVASKNSVEYFSVLVHDMRKKLPQFKYDQANLQEDIEREHKKLQVENEYIYEGQVNSKTGMRDGIGTQTWVDGTYYEGYWKNDLQNGRGRVFRSDGDVYEGQFIDGNANGKGKLISYSEAGGNGSTYTGEFVDNYQHGKGHEEWPEGDVYDGIYIKGVRDGPGVLKMADGSKYTGTFKKNCIHGFGQYQWSDGRIYNGGWNFNKMHGRGVFTWKDGRKYEGEYYNDKKHGKGLFIWADGQRYDGQWVNGVQHGIGFHQDNARADKRKSEWKNGKRVRWIHDNDKKNDDSDEDEQSARNKKYNKR
eukprot:403349759